MKFVSKTSVAGFVIGFICFPIIVFGGAYVYVQFASGGISGGDALSPPELPAEAGVNLDWPVKTLDGVEVNLRDHARNKTLFLNFWATWCGPCVAELPSIEKLYSQFGSDIAFVCVSQENAETLKKFIQFKKYTFPVFYIDTLPPSELNATAIPSTFIISPDGEILLKHVGGADWAHESVISFLREKLARG